MNVHFLLSGYLFYWVVIGVDPTPRQIPQLGKLAMVFALAAVARILRRGADGHADRAGRAVLPVTAALAGTPTCSAISGSAVESPGPQAKSRSSW